MRLMNSFVCGKRADVLRHLGSRPVKRAKLGNEMRVGQEAHVED